MSAIGQAGAEGERFLRTRYSLVSRERLFGFLKNLLSINLSWRRRRGIGFR